MSSTGHGGIYIELTEGKVHGGGEETVLRNTSSWLRNTPVLSKAQGEEKEEEEEEDTRTHLEDQLYASDKDRILSRLKDWRAKRKRANSPELYSPFQIELLMQLLARVEKRFEFRFDLVAFILLFGCYLVFPLALAIDLQYNNESWDKQGYTFICSSQRSCVLWFAIYVFLFLANILFFTDPRGCVGPFLKFHEYFQCEEHFEKQPCSMSRAEVYFPNILYVLIAVGESVIASSYMRASVISTKHQTHNVLGYIRWKTKEYDRSPINIKHYAFQGEAPEEVRFRKGSMRHIGSVPKQDHATEGRKQEKNNPELYKWGAVVAGGSVCVCFGAAIGVAIGSIFGESVQGFLIGCAVGATIAGVGWYCCRRRILASYAGVQQVLEGYWKEKHASKSNQEGQHEPKRGTLDQMFNGVDSLYDVASIVLSKDVEEEEISDVHLRRKGSMLLSVLGKKDEEGRKSLWGIKLTATQFFKNIGRLSMMVLSSYQ
jgi:hypothetical protein